MKSIKTTLIAAMLLFTVNAALAQDNGVFAIVKAKYNKQPQVNSTKITVYYPEKEKVVFNNTSGELIDEERFSRKLMEIFSNLKKEGYTLTSSNAVEEYQSSATTTEYIFEK